MKLEQGQTYTRDQIADAFDGLGPAPLPAKKGKVVAGLFDLAADAVTHLSGEVTLYARSLSKAASGMSPGDPIPLFLKISSQLWRYAGKYKLTQLSRSEHDREKAKRELGRDGVAAVLTFEPLGPKLEVVQGSR